MSKRRGILLSLGGLGVALAGILVISAILRQSFAQPLPPTPKPPLTERVVVSARDIAVGSLLSPTDLTQIDVPLGLAPQGAMRETGPVVNRIAKVPLVAGEMVMAHHLADPTNINHDLAFTLDDDQVMMAFPATDLMSELDILQRGDLVDILVSLEVPVSSEEDELIGQLEDGEEKEPEEVLFTFNALQQIEISAMVVDIIPARRSTLSASASRSRDTSDDSESTPEPTPTPEPAEVEPQALLLGLSPQDALVLKHLKDAGGVFDIVLRAPTSEQIFDLVPVMPDYLIDRYELGMDDFLYATSPIVNK